MASPFPSKDGIMKESGKRGRGRDMGREKGGWSDGERAGWYRVRERERKRDRKSVV